MDKNNRNCEEVEIDLGRYIKMLVKHKKTFITVFLLIFAVGIVAVKMQSSAKIYKVSMMIQPPVVGQSLTGANDLESAENLKGLIVNGAFNDELKKNLNLDSDNINLEFKVAIPNKTNILQVSIDLEDKKKELGIDLLQSLSKSISDRFTKSIEAKIADISNQIKLNENSIINAKEKSKNLQEQIKEVTVREDKLREEIKVINENTAQILAKREGLLKDNAATENVSILLLTNFVQNNSSYSNQLNNQFSDLSIRRVNLSLELKNIDTQIINFQAEIGKLNINKGFISNLKIIARPRVSSVPMVSSNKKKTLPILIVIGLFLGVFAAFLQEFWVNNLVKK